MIKEDYVSAEVARLLKEKGFNQPLLTFYVYVDNNYSNEVGVMAFTDDTIENNSDLYVLAPTLQMAMKWLRKEHNICIIPTPVVTDDDGEVGCLWRYMVYKKLQVLYVSETLYETFDCASNEAIKYCLETLI